MRKLFVIAILLVSPYFYAQIDQNIYELNSLDALLTEEVKIKLSENIKDKKVVFLGEAGHNNGSDFLAKTEFVKYLVNEKGYKDIVFESDFFALYFDHSKHNLYTFWSKSEQCEELFKFLDKNNVKIWGFDNRINNFYSLNNFSKKLSKLLQTNNIKLDQEFIRLNKIIIRKEYNSRKELSKQEINYLENYVLKLLAFEVVKKDLTWTQILTSYQSAIKLYTVKDNYNDLKRFPIRDHQMAKNLDFLVKKDVDRKLVVWLANGHMSKSNHAKMNGQTMGYQFMKLNPNSSYHIAFGSIKTYNRTEKDLSKGIKKRDNILSYLPSLENNYFFDSRNTLLECPELKDKKYDDMFVFNLYDHKTYLLNHFDAFVFIAKGIEVSYPD